MTLLNETDGSETILSVTATHPFYSQNGTWVHASKLKVGEKLIEDGGGTLTVTSVAFNPNAKSALTYNLTVADYHTYFVGEDGVLVHNGEWGRRVMSIIIFPRLIAGDIDVPNSDGSNGRIPPRPSPPVPVDPRRWRKVKAFGKLWKIHD